jgi:hypothetical protein
VDRCEADGLLVDEAQAAGHSGGIHSLPMSLMKKSLNWGEVSIRLGDLLVRQGSDSD